MNKFLVGLQGDDVVFLRPLPQRLTQQDAVLLAAWLIVTAHPTEEYFRQVLEQVQNG